VGCARQRCLRAGTAFATRWRASGRRRRAVRAAEAKLCFYVVTLNTFIAILWPEKFAAAAWFFRLQRW
jgi:hypothetical protein